MKFVVVEYGGALARIMCAATDSADSAWCRYTSRMKSFSIQEATAQHQSYAGLCRLEWACRLASGFCFCCSGTNGILRRGLQVEGCRMGLHHGQGDKVQSLTLLAFAPHTAHSAVRFGSFCSPKPHLWMVPSGGQVPYISTLVECRMAELHWPHHKMWSLLSTNGRYVALTHFDNPHLTLAVGFFAGLLLQS